MNEPSTGLVLTTPYGVLTTRDLPTAATLRWVFGDLAADGTALSTSTAPAMLSVTYSDRPWEYWNLAVDEVVVEPALDLDGVLTAVLRRLDSALAARGELTLSGAAIEVQCGAALVFGLDAVAVAITGARLGRSLLAAGVIRLALDGDTFVAHPYPRPVSQTELVHLSAPIHMPPDLTGTGHRPLPYVPVTAVPGTRLAAVARPVSALIIRRPSDGDPKLDSLAAPEFVHEVCQGDSLVSTAGSAAFHSLSALARAVPIYTLSGRGPLTELVSCLPGGDT
jgi:hypothetical protein